MGDLQHFPGTQPRITRAYSHLRADTYPVETEAEGYVGERDRYSEPTMSITIDAIGVPTALARRLLDVLREIQAVETKDAAVA